MANQWFRMYSEFAHDPKVQMLSEVDQRRYIMLLCLKCCNGDVTLHVTEVAFQLRISNEELDATKQRLIQKGLVNDQLIPTAWDKRQFISDSSAARVAKFREKQKQGRNVTVTKSNALDTDTDTDTDTDKKNKNVKKRAKGMDMLLKAGVPEDLAEDYLAVRRAKKAPFTKTAMKGLAGEAEKANIDLNRAITICINRNWQTFNSEWAWDTKKNGNNHGTNKSLYKSAIQSAAESISQAVQDDFTEHQQSFCPDVRNIR